MLQILVWCRPVSTHFTPPQPYLYKYGLLIIATTVTPAHAGSGRGYGVVDLPIQRDSMGYPIIWASSFKGALKTQLLRVMDKTKVEALLGSEPGGEITFPGIANILDLIPLAVPVPSAEEGVVFITTPYLLSRVKSYIDIVSNVLEKLDHYRENQELSKALKSFIDILFERIVEATREHSDTAVFSINSDRDVTIITYKFKAKGLNIDPSICEALDNELSNMHPLYNAFKFTRHLLVIRDGIGRSIIESGIQRVYRIAVDRDTKTVKEGALWSEEYLPQATLLISVLTVSDLDVLNKAIRSRKDIEKRIKNAYISIESIEKLCKDILSKVKDVHLFIGGKETIGRGIIHFKIASVG